VKVQQGPRFEWLDRQAAERGVAARGSDEQEERKASKFNWLSRRKDNPAKIHEPDRHRKDRNQSDRDR